MVLNGAFTGSVGIVLGGQHADAGVLGVGSACIIPELAVCAGVAGAEGPVAFNGVDGAL